ncbi:phosphotransferase family protein [Nonomuraea cypriaca]|uniref:phosphotransferase family protein n=1 Tax=Nonomuraea cypriaca TaxID=1187855 RepID=UPI002E2C59EE|nr:phosphotransferase [Nonomuraea cypriaca]
MNAPHVPAEPNPVADPRHAGTRAASGRRFVTREELGGLVREAFGAGRRLVQVERLRGGSKKGVYRLLFDSGPSAVLYVWTEDEDYWGGGRADEEPFSHASGLRLFEAAHARLTSLGVRVPHLYLADGDRRHHPADIALIEDVRGGTLEARPAKEALDRLADGLSAMARCRSPELGKVALVESGQGIAKAGSGIVLERAVRDLAEAAARVEPIRAERARLEDGLRELAAGVAPRSGHGLVHGELGPDHVLLDEHDQPVLIDIEGAMFFDVEWEHVFLRIRFGDHYERLRVDGLDERRMRFYELAQHLSLVAGPLRLLEGDFPDREFMMGIVRHHTREALGFPLR